MSYFVSVQQQPLIKKGLVLEQYLCEITFFFSFFPEVILELESLSFLATNSGKPAESENCTWSGMRAAAGQGIQGWLRSDTARSAEVMLSPLLWLVELAMRNEFQVRQSMASCRDLEQMSGGRSLEHSGAGGEGALSHLLPWALADVVLK